MSMFTFYASKVTTTTSVMDSFAYLKYCALNLRQIFVPLPVCLDSSIDKSVVLLIGRMPVQIPPYTLLSVWCTSTGCSSVKRCSSSSTYRELRKIISFLQLNMYNFSFNFATKPVEPNESNTRRVR